MKKTNSVSAGSVAPNLRDPRVNVLLVALRKVRDKVTSIETAQSVAMLAIEEYVEAGKRGAAASTGAPVEQSDELAQWTSVDNWPLPDVLNKLADATERLLSTYNYDGDGWEELKYAAVAARRHAALLVAAPLADPEDE